MAGTGHQRQNPNLNIGIALYHIPDPACSPPTKRVAWALVVHDGFYTDQRVLMYQLYWSTLGSSNYIRPVFVAVDQVSDPSWDFIGIAHVGSCRESLDDITRIVLSVQPLGHYTAPNHTIPPPTAWALDALHALWRAGALTLPFLVENIYDKVHKASAAHMIYREQTIWPTRVPVLDISTL